MQGTYEIAVSALASGDVLDGQYLTTYFQLDVVIKEAVPPYFDEELKEQEVWVGNSWKYTIPDALHDEGLEVEYEVELGQSANFVTYEESTKSFCIEAKTTESKDAGLYFIQITLKDKNGVESDPYVLYAKPTSFTIAAPGTLPICFLL